MAICENYDVFLFDCDGVLWHGKHEIEGAADVIRYLYNHGKRIFLVTNNGTKTRKILLETVENVLGIKDFPSESMYSSGIATVKYLKSIIQPKEKVFLIGSLGLKQLMDENGINYIGYGHLEPRTFTDFGDFELDPLVKYVVGSFDPYANHNKITQAYLYIKENNAQYIASNMDKRFPFSATRTLPGTGAILAGLNQTLGYGPVIIGKPSSIFYDIISSDQKLPDKSKVLMIGDNLNTDIMFAKNSGIDSALVLTGVVKPEDARNRDSLSVKPTFIIDSVRNLIPQGK